jgi:hypothetical protein
MSEESKEFMHSQMCKVIPDGWVREVLFRQMLSDTVALVVVTFWPTSGSERALNCNQIVLVGVVNTGNFS